jgi:hypothetical protein
LWNQFGLEIFVETAARAGAAGSTALLRSFAAFAQDTVAGTALAFNAKVGAFAAFVTAGRIGLKPLIYAGRHKMMMFFYWVTTGRYGAYGVWAGYGRNWAFRLGRMGLGGFSAHKQRAGGNGGRGGFLEFRRGFKHFSFPFCFCRT